MAAARKLYRSNDAVVSGVCAGVAEYFDIDPAATRILAVLMTFSTFGLFVVVYAVLWLVLPRHVVMASDPIPYTVYDRPWSPRQSNYRSRESSRATSRRAPRGFAAPEPAALGAEWNSEQGAYRYVAEAPGSQPACNPTYVAPCSKAKGAGDRPERDSIFALARFCVWMGLLLLCAVSGIILSVVFTDIRWWQFWPVVLVFIGLGLMAVPVPSHRMVRFSLGLSSFSIGAVLLTMSVGLLSWHTASWAASRLWPVLLVVLGLVVVAAALREELFVLAAALCIFAACAATVTVFAIPGSLDHVAFTVPFGEERVLDVEPWM